MSLTPDGLRYLAMAEGRRMPRPFHLRWLMPMALKTEREWRIATWAHLVWLAVLAVAYVGSPWAAIGVLLPGVWFNWRHPVLVDGMGMAWALSAAVVFTVNPVAGVAVVLFGACVRETVPVWAAVYAWHPLLLVGLVPVGIRWLMKEGGSDLAELGAENQWILDHPLRAGWKYHSGRLFDWQLWVAPWGPLVVALGALDLQLVVALGLGYGQCAMATDSVRLYQWAWPVVMVAAVAVVPAAWLPLLALGVVFNPWRGDGI